VAQATFGQVIERTVNGMDEGKGNEAIDLDMGKVFSLPAEFGRWSPAERTAWIQTRGIDLLAQYAKSRWALAGIEGFDLKTVDDGQWQHSTPAALLQLLDSPAAGAEVVGRDGFGYCFLDLDVKTPVTFVFRTREGGAGLLQITDTTDRPRALKVGYKMC
jgi:hypothetical protein